MYEKAYKNLILITLSSCLIAQTCHNLLWSQTQSMAKDEDSVSSADSFSKVWT